MSATSQYTPIAFSFFEERERSRSPMVHPNPGKVRRGWRGGTAASRRARFQALCVA
ncbi:MAG TPA: hypothetical protein VJ821_10120 [Anaerolineales bacterium]|nr:hypothetical protein [Anaerolineales bacterium]